MPLLARKSRAGSTGSTENGSVKKMKVLVILGSVRDGRMGERVGKFVVEKLKECGHDVELADPEKIDIPLLKNPIHFYPEAKKAPKHVREWNETVLGCDAVVVVTPEYNRNLPPALLNLMDHATPTSYAWKAAGIVSYSMGPFGGNNAHTNARSYLVELGMAPVPYMFSIPEVQNALDSEGKPADEKMDGKAKKFLEQFNWLATALKNQRDSSPLVWDGPVVSG